jgi:hypothetical protein
MMEDEIRKIVSNYFRLMQIIAKMRKLVQKNASWKIDKGKKTVWPEVSESFLG